MSDYDNLITQSIQADRAQSARVGFTTAADTNPDAYAEAQRVARRTGVPVDTALAMPQELKKQARIGEIDFDTMAATSPATAAILADVEKAKIAHDNVESMTAIEETMGFLKKTGRAGLSGLYGASAGVVGVAQAPFDLLAPMADPLAGTLLPENPLRRVAAGLSSYRKDIQATSDYYRPKGEGVLESGWYSGIGSLSRNLATLPLAFAPGGQGAALTGMVAPVFGEEFGKARDKGIAPVQAATYGMSQAAVEYATEKLPVSWLVRDLKAGAGFGKTIINQMAAEIPGEQVATVLQDLNEWATINPDKPFADYLRERPSAAAQTLIATVVGSGGQISVMKGAELAVNLATGKADQAQQGADIIARLNDLAKADKVLQRSPETFEQFIAQAADGGPVQQVFIDAQTLMQSGVAEQLAAVSPAVAEQLQEAVATGGQIAIPVEEYAARIAPTEYAQSLVDHLKVDPEGFSRAEAQEYMQSQSGELQAEVERAIAEQQNDDAFKASAEVVRSGIKKQLDTAARFTPQVNDAYAAMVGNFYAVQAARLGVTPEELFARYPLKVAAESVAGGQEFAQNSGMADKDTVAGTQAPTSAGDGSTGSAKATVPEADIGESIEVDGVMRATRNSRGQLIAESRNAISNFWRWFGDSKVVDNNGRPLVVFHGTNADFDSFDLDFDARNVGGFWLSDSEIYSWDYFGNGDNGKVLRLYAKASNPLVFDVIKEAELLAEDLGIDAPADSAEAQNIIAENNGWWDLAVSQAVEKAQASGNDAVIISSFSDGRIANTTAFVIWDGLAIKSAIPKTNLSFDEYISGRGIKEKDGKFFARGFELRSTRKTLEADWKEELELREKFGASDFDAKSTKIGDAAKPNEPSASAGSDVLHQQARGRFNPATLQITLLKNADLSTFLHESGHAFLEMQFDMAERIAGLEGRTEGEQQLLDDTAAVLKWFGIRDLAEWNGLDFEEKRSYHEKFARGFEAYLFEGKAPSIEMQGLFQRFRAWMVSVYRELKALNVELTDEVRGVFDRMLASTDEIKLAEQGRSMMPLFTSPEQAGMTPEEFAAYQALGVDATNEAIEDLQARGLRDMQWLRNARGRVVKQLQKEAKEQRAAVEMDVRREVMSQPIYRAWEFLTGKNKTGTDTVVEGEDGLRYSAHGKLNLEELRENFPEEIANHMQALRMTAKEGIPLDLVAEMFGFSSGDELVRRLAAANTPKDEIESLTDLRMLEQFGDLASDEAIERAADKAIHNEARARMIATEANALAKAIGQRKVLASAAKEYARALIDRLKVRSIKPGQYASAEARAARAADKASKAGDVATAAAEKRNQLIQNYATRSAYDAQDAINAGLRYLKKFDGDIKGLDADYADQIAQLLERFDLRKGQSLKAIDKRAALADWIKAQREAGLEPDIPPALENEAFRKSYKDMTVEEFRGLIDTVKQIEHLGRLKHKLLTAKDQREYEAVRDEIVASVRSNAQGRQADTRTPTTNMGRAISGLKRFWASHIKAATWARVMDGGQDGGPMWEYFIRTANERGDQETTMRAEATARLSEIISPVFKLGKMGGKGQFFPSIGRSLNREARIAIALNVGNEGNLQRLMGGEGWNEAQVVEILDTLSPTEWRAVQAVWDHFESYRPQIAAKERRVYGKEPEWVEPGSRVIARYGLRGGYYPIKYDPAASQRAEEHNDAEAAKRQLQGAYTSATTRRSFTKGRVEEVSGRPLLYTLAGLYSGVNDVIHDLAWHEWLIDANRLLRSKSIDSAIREHYGPEAKQQFKTWVQDVAEGEKGMDAAVDVALARLRQGVSAAGLGFNIMSALIQPLGITQSIVRVGAPWVARGVARYIAHPLDVTREVVGKSSFMENRARTRFRELNELRNRVQSSGVMANFDEFVGRYAYFMMMRCQQMVDVPTWVGAYEKAIAEGNDEERAISLADQSVIDAQGGGQTKDLSAIERGGPAQKLFTVFYSFMNTAMNLGVSQTMTADTPSKRAKLAADYLMLYTVPAVLGYFIKAAFTPGDSGDDDPEKIARKLLANQIDYLMGVMVVVREFGEVVKTITGANDMGRDYTGPAGLRLIADSVSLANQASQGEFDTAFRKAAVNVIGDLFGLPAAQVNRTWTGVEALADGETDNPAAIAFGFQRNR